MSFIKIVTNPSTTTFVITAPLTSGSPLIVSGIGPGTKVRVHDNAQRFDSVRNNVYDFVVDSIAPIAGSLVGSPIPPSAGAFYTVTIDTSPPSGFLSSIPVLSGSPEGQAYIGMIAGWYDINLTDGTLLVDIPPFEIDGPNGVSFGSPIPVSSSIDLPGRGSLNYGEYLLEDLIRMLENFADGVSPPSPLVGQLWFDTEGGAASPVEGAINFYDNFGMWTPLLSEGVADTIYLRLDTTNDPLTNTLEINGSGSPQLALIANGDIQVNSQVIGSDQGAGTPTYSFTSDRNIGMYRAGSDTLAFSTSGTERLRIQSDGSLSVQGTTNYEDVLGQYVPGSNDDLIPSLKWLNDQLSWREPVRVKDDTIYVGVAGAEAALNSGSPLGTLQGVQIKDGDRILYTGIAVSAGSPVVFGSPLTTRNVYLVNGTPGSGATLVEDTNVETHGDTVYVIDGDSAGAVFAYDKTNNWSLISGTGVGSTLQRELRTDIDAPGGGSPSEVITLSTITYTTGSNALFVYVNGQKTVLGEDYIELSSTSIQWIGVPLTSGVDIVEFFSIESLAAEEIGVGYDEFIASGGETTVSTSNVTVQTKVGGKSFQQVFLNGILLREGSDGSPTTGGYYVSGANQITINPPFNPLDADDEILIYAL